MTFEKGNKYEINMYNNFGLEIRKIYLIINLRFASLIMKVYDTPMILI